MYTHRDFLIVFAAGNDGECGASGTVAPPGTAKSILTVGASVAGFDGTFSETITEDIRDTVAFFSSQGPTEDGRIKPEVPISKYLHPYPHLYLHLHLKIHPHLFPTLALVGGSTRLVRVLCNCLFIN